MKKQCYYYSILYFDIISLPHEFKSQEVSIKTSNDKNFLGPVLALGNGIKEANQYIGYTLHGRNPVY